MKRVELFGPPGVGKTTIYRAAMATRSSSVRQFYSFDETRLFEVASGFEWQTCSTWQAFVGFVIFAYARCSGRKALVRSRHHATQRAITKAAAIAGTRGDAPVLVDESLCQRGLSLALSQPRDNAIVEAYFRAMPAPAVAAFVVADRKIISARNVGRKALEAGVDRSADASASLHTCRVGAEMLRARGVEVVEINAGISITANTAALVAVMERV